MRRYSNTVGITGIGIASPAGNTLDMFFCTLCKGEYIGNSKSRERMRGKAAREKWIRMCSEAVESAIADWGGDVQRYDKITLLVGSGLGYTDAWMRELVDERGFLASLIDDLRVRLPISVDIQYFANACCAGMQAISHGADLIGYNLKEIVIAGGIDIYSNIAEAGFKRLNAIDPVGCRPFSKSRRGISMGEGAVFFILENAKEAKYGQICGYGLTFDALDTVRMDPSGRYMKNAIWQAMETAEMERESVDLIISHGTGTLQNDEIESRSIWEIFHETENPPYVCAPKSVLGHTGGASGAFGLLVAIVIAVNATIPNSFRLCEKYENGELPLINIGKIKHQCKRILVNCFAFGGTNVVIVWEGTHASTKD